MHRARSRGFNSKAANLNDRPAFPREACGRNIEDDAATILASAAQCADAILARRAWLDAHGQADKPLVVLAGENHANPAHSIHHLLVWDRICKARKDSLYLMELPHNQVFYSALLPQDTAMHSQFILAYALLQRNAPVFFSDAVLWQGVDGPYLNMHDPSTADSLKACAKQVFADISALGPEGMHARNHHMARMAEELAATHHAGIVFQQCGNAHVIGDVSQQLFYPTSLAAQCKERGLPVLALPVREDATPLPARHGLAPGEGKSVGGLPDVSLYYARLTGREAVLSLEKAEAAYTNGLLERTGLTGDTVSVENFWNIQQQIGHILNENAKKGKTPSP